MKKVIVLVSVIIILIFLNGCETPEPLENPSPELFSDFYVDDEYMILKKTHIDPVAIYNAYAVILETFDGDTCTVGHYHEVNYMFLYNEKYYGIREASKLDIFTCDDLEEVNVINFGGLVDE